MNKVWLDRKEADWEKKNNVYCGIILVRGERCSWISWVTLTHEFTPRNYVPTNRQYFYKPQILARTNKNGSTVRTMHAKLEMRQDVG